MGDLMHALPALTDARGVWPDLEVDWVVDESFAEVPSWHPAVRHIYKSAHRRWKKRFLGSLAGGEFSRFYKAINAHDYDVMIDAQNNVKSSVISWLRKGPVHGMDRASVAEQPAFLAYKYRHFIDKNQHAIARQRRLFASAMGYEVPATAPEYGLKEDAFCLPDFNLERPYIFLVHNASWSTKLWPENYWHELISKADSEGYQVVLPGGSQTELNRAAELAQSHTNAVALPRLTLSDIGGIIQHAAGAICCDTGLAHLTAITGTPAITFYGPTSDKLIGTSGKNQRHLVASDPPYHCAPCYKRYCNFSGSRSVMSDCMASFSPGQAWLALKAQMGQ